MLLNGQMSLGQDLAEFLCPLHSNQYGCYNNVSKSNYFQGHRSPAFFASKKSDIRLRSRALTNPLYVPLILQRLNQTDERPDLPRGDPHRVRPKERDVRQLDGSPRQLQCKSSCLRSPAISFHVLTRSIQSYSLALENLTMDQADKESVDDTTGGALGQIGSAVRAYD